MKLILACFISVLLFNNLTIRPALPAVIDPVNGNTDTAQDSCTILLGDRFKIDISNDGKERQFPFVYKFGKNIFVSYSEHKDMIIASPTDAMIISRDNGKTWGEKTTNSDFYITSITEKEGILYGIVYFTYLSSSKRERMIYWTSTNSGKTWVRHEGIVKAPKGKQFVASKQWGSMLFHRGMSLARDGSFQGVMYGRYEGDKFYRVVWVKSTDNCATWHIVATVASGVPDSTVKKAQGYCEPTFIRTKDNSLLCVMRMGSYLPLYQCRSHDNGRTWSAPVPLPGLSSTAAESVDPHLVLMQNGMLALSYGRPYNKMAISRDGCGYNWDCQINTYEGQTEGYTGIVESDPGTLLLISDQGRTGAKEMAIWGRFIQVHTLSTSSR